MSAPSEHMVVVPQPLASRLEQMVSAGEFATFALAAVAMIELGVMQHDGHLMPPGGPPPPPLPGPARDIPPPGPGGGAPRVSSESTEQTRRAPSEGRPR